MTAEWNAAASRIARSPSPKTSVATRIVHATSGGWSKYERSRWRAQVQ